MQNLRKRGVVVQSDLSDPASFIRCTVLPWDSEFFGVRIARAEAPRGSAGQLSRTLRWAEENAVRCLYLLAPSDDAELTWALQAGGFRLVDLRVTLEVRPAPQEVSEEIRSARPSDVSNLREIARVSHRDGRFHFDENFSRERCDALYETWIARSCARWADTVLIGEHEGQPAGYVTCHLDPGPVGRIGLLAVEARGQGRGLGGALVRAANNWFSLKGCKHATVVTQGRNAVAQRLYQRGGFVTRSVEQWFHHWLD